MRHRDGSQRLRVPEPAKFKAGLAHDVSDADAAFLRHSQVPINMSACESNLTNAAWRTRPSWAVIATEDKAFDQAMLLHMAKPLCSDHHGPCQPRALHHAGHSFADTIEQAAQEAVKVVTNK